MPSPARQADSSALLLAALGIADPDSQAAVSAAQQVLERFLETFNARDAKAWAQTLHFPHVRLTAGEVQLWQTPADYERSNDLAAFAETGWAYTRWDRVLPVQAGADKVHFALQFTRYDAAHQPIVSHQALYVVTRLDGRWGIQSRSSYAGIALPGAAF